MNLSELLSGLTEAIPEDLEITNICTNSAEVTPGTLFLAVKGALTDRHDFVADAFSKGATAAIVSRRVTNGIEVVVQDVDGIAPEILRRFHRHPDEHLFLIGVTGTDGKTSVTTITQQLLGSDRCGCIGTNGVFLGASGAATPNTTPDANRLFGYLAQFVHAGAQYATIEVSSEGIHYGRLEGFSFDVMAHTNITREHLNTHGSIENYVSAKLQAFSQHLKPCGTAIINADDAYAGHVLAALDGQQAWTYGAGAENELQIVEYSLHSDHTDIQIRYHGAGRFVRSPLLGRFNVENLSCSLLCCAAAGLEIDEALKRIDCLHIDGRMEVFERNGVRILVDYAHTANGVSKFLEFVLKTDKPRRLITVMGQPGERDSSKRPIVGRLLAEFSDIAIFTLQDPRHEEVNDILTQMCADLDDHLLHKVTLIRDRGDAIDRALSLAKSGDIVAILGKGTDDHLLVGDDRIPFSDMEHAKHTLEHAQL